MYGLMATTACKLGIASSTKQSSNPITDPWLDGGEAFEGMAKGPIKLEGLQSGAPLMYSTYYHGEIAELPSRMDIVKLGGSAPAYMWPDQSGSDLAGDIYETVLSNLGNEKPWCIDSHTLSTTTRAPTGSG